MTFAGSFARDLIIAVIGATLLMLAVNGLSKLDHKFAGTASSSQEHLSVVTDDCGAAVRSSAKSAGDCRADFFVSRDGARR